MQLKGILPFILILEFFLKKYSHENQGDNIERGIAKNKRVCPIISIQRYVTFELGC